MRFCPPAVTGVALQVAQCDVDTSTSAMWTHQVHRKHHVPSVKAVTSVSAQQRRTRVASKAEPLDATLTRLDAICTQAIIRTRGQSNTSTAHDAIFL